MNFGTMLRGPQSTLVGMLLILGLLAVMPQAAEAQVPRTISYQGVALDGNGDPLAPGDYSMRFVLYPTASSTTPLYEETQTVTIDEGYFGVRIGAVAPIPDAVRFDRPYFLGVSLGNSPELTPRIPLTSSPYALTALRADSAVALASGARGVVRGLNGIEGSIRIVGGAGVTVSAAGDSLVIAATGGTAGVSEITNSDGALVISNATGPVTTVDLARHGIPLTALDTTGGADGQILKLVGDDVVYALDGLSLPYEGTASDSIAFSITNPGKGSAGVFKTTDPTNLRPTLYAETSSRNAIFGQSMGPAGTGVRGHGYSTSNGVAGWSDSATGVYASTVTGAAVVARGNNGFGVIGSSSGNLEAGAFLTDAFGSAAALSAISGNDGPGLEVSNNSGGYGASIEITQDDNDSAALIATTAGGGSAIHAIRENSTGTTPAIVGEAHSTSAGSAIATGSSGVLGIVKPTSPGAWSAGVRGVNNGTGGNGIGVAGYQDGSGWGVAGESASGTGVLAMSGEGGNALVAILSGNGTPSNFSDNIAVFATNGSNKARIDATGKGFFNGGTVNSGADIAELLDVEGDVTSYKPGDVMAISTSTNRTVELATGAYSSLVVGVYATSPGVLLMEQEIQDDVSDKIPMGVVGIIPTNVTNEGGPIARGDMLVVSSTPGHAMKADVDQLKNHPGATIGKALEPFDGETGTIRVLVNVR